MTPGQNVFAGVLLVIFLPTTEAWHAFGSSDTHCWKLGASPESPAPYEDCPGVKLAWIDAPGKEMRAEDEFNITIELTIDPDLFGPWAEQEKFFDYLKNESTIQDPVTWCLETNCTLPSPDYSPLKDYCCIHHVNIHSCPMDTLVDGLCGPWIPDDGLIVTHSKALAGPYSTGNWTNSVHGLARVGLHSMIGHFKIGGMQIAIERKIKVFPRAVCGDKICDGKEGEDCETCPKDCGSCPMETWEQIAIALTVVVFFGALGAMFAYIQYERMKLLWSNDWIIPPEEIKDDEGLRGAFGSMIGSVVELKKVGTATSQLNAGMQQVFARTACYKNQSCVVRTIIKQDFTLTRKIRLEVREVRECDHTNLVKFVGACIVIPNMAILNEYCAKGSLSDVLQNEEAPLNWAFRFSFLTDIARGMNYLHSKGMIHGRLKSNNCVVDDRWTVKVTDFGLNELRQNIYRPEDYEGLEDEAFQFQRDLVYVAPEIKSGHEPLPTMKSDLYSYAIIMYEVATRSDPHDGQDFMLLGPNWKPNLPNLNSSEYQGDDRCPCPVDYKELLSVCWQKDPTMRPKFSQVRASIRKINPSKLGPVDLMMAMMEKYSLHLESIVAERTQGLVAEKAKTDRLLYSMLPKAVADLLRQGLPVSARYHDICTIYFSDIVGFTTISGRSKPMQVVELLNKLYINFDDVIDKYEVYKVETIGDAYMVVSGIPVFNEHHARECADMAIDLVKVCETFEIPHLKSEPLKIRIGLHTGPACAGVVGVKMPRYCLFGDTVNVASRMESNSEAYKIHVSNPCYEKLVIYGKYILETRGTLSIKGKGNMITWWVHGHDPAFVDERA